MVLNCLTRCLFVKFETEKIKSKLTNWEKYTELSIDFHLTINN